MLKLLLWVSVVCVIFYAAACAAVFSFQRKLEYAPNTSRPDPAAAGLPTLRELHIETPTGLRLLAWYLPAEPGKPVLAYFHGNGGNLQNRIPRFLRAARVGWGILMVEYPGYGGNLGSPTELGFAEATVAAMAFLDGQGIEHRRTVVYGESIGTGVATRVAAGRDIAALVLEAPFTSAAAIAERLFPWLPVRWLMLDRFDQVSRIRSVEAPILILQGSRDRVVPPDLGLALYDAAPQPKRLWVAPEGEHENLMDFGAWDKVVRFVGQATSGQPMLPPAAVEIAGSGG
jgi:fermentation-respiration switch protein FrsA (DUF1100 family)